MEALSNVLIVGLLNFEQKATKVLVSLDDLVEGLIECLHLSVFVIRGFLKSVCQ